MKKFLYYIWHILEEHGQRRYEAAMRQQNLQKYL